MVKLLYESIIGKYMKDDQTQIKGEGLEIPGSAEKNFFAQNEAQDKIAGIGDLSSRRGEVDRSKRDEWSELNQQYEGD